MDRDEVIRMRVGDLFWWNKSVLVEFLGHDGKGKLSFRTTNGGIISGTIEDVMGTISKD